MSQDMHIPMPRQLIADLDALAFATIPPAPLFYPDIGGPSPKEPSVELRAQAARLYPQSEVLQRKWLHSVIMLRAGRGWILDRGTPAPGWHARPHQTA